MLWDGYNVSHIATTGEEDEEHPDEDFGCTPTFSRFRKVLEEALKSPEHPMVQRSDAKDSTKSEPFNHGSTRF